MAAPRDLSWRLRLFFSVDLVGSTAFKTQSQSSDAPDWADSFREFYTQFPEVLRRQYEKLPEAVRPAPAMPLTPMLPWKFNGDEILLQTQLACYQQALTHTVALQQAVDAFAEQCASKCPMPLKVTGWLAGFPVTNTEVRIDLGDGRDGPSDYLGPSVDLGFRLARCADQNRAPVSVDLAVMLIDAAEHMGYPGLFLHYAGREYLRGVRGGAQYPLVQMAVACQDQARAEAKLLGRVANDEPLREFLRQYITDTAGLRMPFIEGDLEERYGTVPPDLERLREQFIAAEAAERDYGETDDAPAEGPEKEVSEVVDIGPDSPG